MVFARTKLVMEDNCFEEEPGTVTIRLVGPNITKLYKQTYELIKAVFNVTDSDIQETMYQWGKGKGKDKFAVTWWLHKDLDSFSYFYISFKLKGQGNEESGSASIDIRGLLRSEYPQDTVWQRSLFYEMMRTFWHRIFYHKKREEYAEDCRHSVILLQRRIHDFFERLKEG
ncbi:MAG: hypothetical protein ISS93_01790 [Candidatus Aenigmarchaeota archaeon]|nr:hypothetical protein [Candidatus Aenigmarchaeota archaeon]